MKQINLIFRIFFLVTSFLLGYPIWAEIQIEDCGSDLNSSANRVGGIFNAKTVANEDAFAALKSDGSISVWGASNKGGLDAPRGNEFKAVYSNRRAFAAIRQDGSIAAWGDADYGGNPGVNYPGAPDDNGYLTIFSTAKAFAAIKADGSISAWGTSVAGGAGAPTDSGYVGVYSNESSFAALNADGSITAWGQQSNAPTDKGYVSIAASAKAFAALKADGRISTWGDGGFGGSGAPNKAGFVSIASSEGGFAALNSDGSISSWGLGYKDWNATYSPAPTGNNFKYITANKTAFAAITKDGYIKTWGNNRYGGEGGPTDKSYNSISASAMSFVAKKSDGSLFAWGGTSGEGNSTPKDSGYISVVSNYYSFTALRADGTVISWGGSDGLHPKLLTTYPWGKSGFTAIASTDKAFAALNKDGTITAWGHDISGGVGAPTDGGYVSINGVSAQTPTDCQFKLSLETSDQVAPVITLNGGAQINIFLGDSYNDAGATATDDRDGAVSVTQTGSVDTSKVGQYRITYSATDKAGNTATKSRTVTVILAADTTKPVITLNGAAQVTLIKGARYVDAGATATDDRDGVVSVTQTGSVDTSKVGQYRITYSATDKAGNTATTTRAVIVMVEIITITTPDTTKPVITLNGEEVLHMDIGETYNEEGAIASDNLDGELPVSISGEVDISKAGTYTITYTAIDKANNAAEILRTINIHLIEDTINPIVSLNGEDILEIKLNETYVEKGAIATDERDGELKVSISGNVDIHKEGTYLLHYSATDSVGNTGHTIRKIVVVSAKEKSAGGSMGWILLFILGLLFLRSYFYRLKIYSFIVVLYAGSTKFI